MPKNSKEYMRKYRIENKERMKKLEYKYYLIKKKTGACNAKATVMRAINKKLLIDLKNEYVKCSYCDKRATVYDHRDYSKPLEVKPVCLSCNYYLPKALSFSSTD